MSYRVKEDFLNYKKGDILDDELIKTYQNWLPYVDNDNTKVEKPSKKKDNFDLNGDGKVDKKDRSLAAKLLGSKKGKVKKRGKK